MNALNQLFSGMRASASALSAERVRMDVIAANLANAQTTSPDGEPYVRRVVHFEPILAKHSAQFGEHGARGTDREEPAAMGGVRVARIAEDHSTPLQLVHDPSHPHAGPDGWVRYPNVNATREMADLITAMRSYEANVRAQQTFAEMAERALQLAR
jgi:flagellar basal-body rod protein FlgC